MVSLVLRGIWYVDGYASSDHLAHCEIVKTKGRWFFTDESGRADLDSPAETDLSGRFRHSSGVTFWADSTSFRRYINHGAQ